MIENRLAREREAETESVFFPGAHERLKEMLADLGANAGARVGHVYGHGFGVERSADMYRTACGHGLERVAHQVDKDAFHAGAFERQFDGFGNVEAYGYALRVGGGSQRVACGRGDFMQVAHLRAFGLSAAHVDQVLQQFLDATRRTVDIPRQALELLRSDFGIHHDLSPAVDRRQRIAEVVDDGARKPSDGSDTLLADQLAARALNRRAHVIEGLSQPT